MSAEVFVSGKKARVKISAASSGRLLAGWRANERAEQQMGGTQQSVLWFRRVTSGCFFLLLLDKVQN